MVFDVALHFGTTIAVLAFFWSDWMKIFQSAFTKKHDHNYPKNLLWQIVIGSIPALIGALLLERLVENFFHGGSTSALIFIAVDVAIFGLILWLVDRYAKINLDLKKVKFGQSFLVGLVQTLALIPGVSRSGATIIASRAIGLKREDAARFSFLLGTPATLGAFLFELRKTDPSMFNLTFFAGVAASAAAGFFAIRYLLVYLQKADFRIFVVYRFILAAIVLSIIAIRL